MNPLSRLLLLPVASVGLLAAGCACPHAGPYGAGPHGPPPGAGMYRDGPGAPPLAARHPGAPLHRVKEGKRAGHRKAPMAARLRIARRDLPAGKARPGRETPRPQAGPGPEDRLAELHGNLRRAMERIERLEGAVSGGNPGGDHRSMGPADELRAAIGKRDNRIRELEQHTRKLEEMLQRLKGELRDDRPEKGEKREKQERTEK